MVFFNIQLIIMLIKLTKTTTYGIKMSSVANIVSNDKYFLTDLVVTDQYDQCTGVTNVVPSEVIALIFEYSVNLNNRGDFLKLGLVCKKWHYITTSDDCSFFWIKKCYNLIPRSCPRSYYRHLGKYFIPVCMPCAPHYFPERISRKKYLEYHENFIVSLKTKNYSSYPIFLKDPVRTSIHSLNALAFADEILIAQCANDTIEFWNIKTRECLFSITTDEKKLNGTLVNFNGKIAVGQSDGKILIYDENTHEILKPLTDHKKNIKYLNEVNGKLITVCEDAIIIYDSATLECLHKHQDQGAYYQSLFAVTPETFIFTAYLALGVMDLTKIGSLPRYIRIDENGVPFSGGGDVLELLVSERGYAFVLLGRWRDDKPSGRIQVIDLKSHKVMTLFSDSHKRKHSFVNNIAITNEHLVGFCSPQCLVNEVEVFNFNLFEDFNPDTCNPNKFFVNFRVGNFLNVVGRGETIFCGTPSGIYMLNILTGDTSRISDQGTSYITIAPGRLIANFLDSNEVTIFEVCQKVVPVAKKQLEVVEEMQSVKSNKRPREEGNGPDEPLPKKLKTTGPSQINPTDGT